MSFWTRLSSGFWRLSLPKKPMTLRPGTASGAKRDGRKHGFWTERGASGVTTVLHYERGEKHGPFRDYHSTGERRTEGTYVDGELDGPWRVWHDDGSLSAIATFDRGKLEGVHRMYLASGEIKLESEYIHNQRHGPWRLLHDDGARHEEGAHDHGLRVGSWRLYDEHGKLREQGEYDSGERNGAFTFFERGEPVLECTFRGGVLDGPFRVLSRSDVVAGGRFRDGIIEPKPTLRPDARTALSTHPPPEPVLRGWIEIESALSVLDPPTELPPLFVEMDDELEPLDDAERSRRNDSLEAWRTLFADTTKLEADARSVVAERVRERLVERPGALLPEVGYPAWQQLVGATKPHALAQFVTSITLDHAHFDEESASRFGQRFKKQLRRLSLFECTFDPSLEAFLRQTRFESLEVLEIADFDDGGRGLDALTELDWASRLVRLAFDGTAHRYDDGRLAKLFDAEAWTALRSLSLGAAEPGPATELAIAHGAVARKLEELHFVESRVPASTIDALAKGASALKRLKLERCTLSLEAVERLETWRSRKGLRLVTVELEPL